MNLSLEKVKKHSEFSDMDDEDITEMMNALEIGIRKETNNNFQNRNVRFEASSHDRILNGTSSFIRTGDTVQISQSGVNDGLYVVTAINADYGVIQVDKELFTVDYNLVTKVEYPADVTMGVLNLMRYIKRLEDASESLSDKVGVASETISRHSVSYDSGNMLNWITGDLSGFPADMLKFLDRYRKARF